MGLDRGLDDMGGLDEPLEDGGEAEVYEGGQAAPMFSTTLPNRSGASVRRNASWMRSNG